MSVLDGVENLLAGADLVAARAILTDDVPARSGAAAVMEAADRVGAHVRAVAEVRGLIDHRVGAVVRCKDLLAVFDRLGV